MYICVFVRGEREREREWDSVLPVVHILSLKKSTIQHVTRALLLWENKSWDWNLSENDENVFLRHTVLMTSTDLCFDATKCAHIETRRFHYFTSEESKSPSKACSSLTWRWNDVMFIQFSLLGHIFLTLKEQMSYFPPCIPAQLLRSAAQSMTGILICSL